MKIVTAKEFNENYGEGTVFAEWRPDIITSDVMVVDEQTIGIGMDYLFGATQVLPYHGEVFDFDWNLGEYKETDKFVIFDKIDILQMIQTLTRGLNLEEELEYEE